MTSHAIPSSYDPSSDYTQSQHNHAAWAPQQPISYDAKKSQYQPSYPDSQTQATQLEPYPERPLPSGPHDPPALAVNIAWRKAKILIHERDKPSDPLFIASYHLTGPTLTFASAKDGSFIGSGNAHAVSIHADYEVNGRKGKLKAYHRWVTEYTHLSGVYKNPDGSPMTMRWTSSCGFKSWDFMCLDENQMPVAKYSANNFAISKQGNIEFLGPLANNQAARDELMVTGITVYWTMLQRSQNIFNLFGAFFARTGHLDEKDEQHVRELEAKDAGNKFKKQARNGSQEGA